MQDRLQLWRRLEPNRVTRVLIPYTVGIVGFTILG